MANEELNTSPVTEEEGLSLQDLFRIIKKHIIAIVAFIVAFSAIGFVYSKVQTPTYKANTTMLVEYDGSDVAISTQYSFSSYISATLVDFMKEEIVLDSVANKCEAANLFDSTKYTHDQIISTIKGNLSVSNKNLIISLTYEDSDPARAISIVNFIGDTAQEVADTTDASGTAKYHLLHDNLKVLSPATKSVKVSKTTKNLLIFFAVGVVGAFIYVLLRELFDTRFRSTEEIEKVLGLPVIASIPDYAIDEKK